jgi:hypothetical protein
VITVTQAPQFTSAASATVAAGRSFSVNIVSTGYPVATITRSGTLPTGITFTAGANGTATLSGTPTSSTAGRSYQLTFRATTSVGSVEQRFILTIASPPTISGNNFAVATTNTSFTYNLQTTGSPTPTITMSGTLPTGLTFVDNRNGTARISGSPVSRTAGIYTVVFTATNTNGSATRTLILTVR